MRNLATRFKASTLTCVAALVATGVASASDELDALKADVAALKQGVKQASEWKYPTTLVHMAGFANVGYQSVNGKGSFKGGQFSPIFHIQYRDILLLESELEFTTTNDGGTEMDMEYLTIDWFLNDYAALVVGKFLSPIGQFRQNLHPSWINKLPSAPVGFMHDGAAPVSDMGFQLRGGLPAGGGKLNYAVYASNGPELVADGTEVEGIAAEGFNTDADGEKTFGGRIGYLPFPALEIGVSAATGKATVTSDEVTGLPVTGQPALDYDVRGADFAFRWKKSLDLRGEYVQTRIGNTTVGTVTDGGAWSTWYVQGAWKIPDTKFEAVTRYGKLASPHPTQDRNQWALGLDYWIASNAVVKIAYEINDNPNAGLRADNRTLFQLAYGF